MAFLSIVQWDGDKRLWHLHIIISTAEERSREKLHKEGKRPTRVLHVKVTNAMQNGGYSEPSPSSFMSPSSFLLPTIRFFFFQLCDRTRCVAFGISLSDCTLYLFSMCVPTLFYFSSNTTDATKPICQNYQLNKSAMNQMTSLPYSRTPESLGW